MDGRPSGGDVGEHFLQRVEAAARLEFPGRSQVNRRLGTIDETGISYGIFGRMDAARKITVEVPEDLLDKAQQATGTGITQTVRAGLQLVAASQAYARLRQLRGKVTFRRTLAEIKADR